MNRVSVVLLVSSLAMLAACASTAPQGPVSEGPNIQGDGTCHAERVAWAIGKPANEPVMKKVWSDSGSGLIRPIAPDRTVIRDYRPDRVNVYLDASNIITKIDCG